MNELPEHISIVLMGEEFRPTSDSSDHNWYELGNMFWCPEYKPFYKWLNGRKINEITDFPHHYFCFDNKIDELDFKNTWGEFVINDCNS